MSTVLGNGIFNTDGDIWKSVPYPRTDDQFAHEFDLLGSTVEFLGT